MFYYFNLLQIIILICLLLHPVNTPVTATPLTLTLGTPHPPAPIEDGLPPTPATSLLGNVGAWLRWGVV